MQKCERLFQELAYARDTSSVIDLRLLTKISFAPVTMPTSFFALEKIPLNFRARLLVTGARRVMKRKSGLSANAQAFMHISSTLKSHVPLLNIEKSTKKNLFSICLNLLFR